MTWTRQTSRIAARQQNAAKYQFCVESARPVLKHNVHLQTFTCSHLCHTRGPSGRRSSKALKKQEHFLLPAGAEGQEEVVLVSDPKFYLVYFSSVGIVGVWESLKLSFPFKGESVILSASQFFCVKRLTCTKKNHNLHVKTSG